jgi:hypothetical protein
MTPPREAARASNLENPAVVNVRRPSIARGDRGGLRAAQRVDLQRAADLEQPQTVLRLPDLAAAVKSWRPQVSLGTIVQWTAIGLGAMVALWLIFGSRPPSAGEAESQSAPAWAPPARHVEAPQARPTATPQNTSRPAAPGLPDWNDPNWSARAGAAPAVGPRSGQPPRESVRTAQRVDRPESNPSPGPPASDAQPLGITVPVQP